MAIKIEWDSELRKAVDPEYQYVVYQQNVDNDDDTIWCFEKTEADAIKRVHTEVEAYGDSEDYQFYYKENPFLKGE